MRSAIAAAAFLLGCVAATCCGPRVVPPAPVAAPATASDRSESCAKFKCEHDDLGPYDCQCVLER
jgi:hypothetical protein